MEELKLVARRRFDHDLRRVKVSLTSKSRALASGMAPLIEAAYADIESAVGSELVRQLYVLIDQLIARIDRANAKAVGERR